VIPPSASPQPARGYTRSPLLEPGELDCRNGQSCDYGGRQPNVGTRVAPPPPRRRVGPTCERADLRQFEIPPEGVRISSVIFRKAIPGPKGPGLRLSRGRLGSHAIRFTKFERMEAGFRGSSRRRHDATVSRGRLQRSNFVDNTIDDVVRSTPSSAPILSVSTSMSPTAGTIATAIRS